MVKVVLHSCMVSVMNRGCTCFFCLGMVLRSTESVIYFYYINIHVSVIYFYLDDYHDSVILLMFMLLLSRSTLLFLFMLSSC